MASKLIRLALCVFVVFLTQNQFVYSKSKIIPLDEDNWNQMLNEEWMVEFYAPWCPACRSLEPVWADFSSWSDELNIKVGQVDVTTSPGLSGRFMVTALPTIFHVLNGEFRQYRGSRDKESFMSFIENKKWENVEAIPSWKSPASFQMSAVAYFFKLSQLLRAVHTHFMENYGLPTWGSYLIFAIATIILGALLGVLMVCLIDRIYPPKYSNMESITEVKHLKKKEEEIEESQDEDYDPLQDDLVDEEGSQDDKEEDDEGEEGDDAGRMSQVAKSESRARQRKTRKAD